MKKYFLLVLFILCGCRVYNLQSVADEYNYNTDKLAENYSIYETDEQDSSNKDDTKMIVESKQKKSYSVILKKHTSCDNENLFRDLIFIGTLGISHYFGIPYDSPTMTCKIEASIYSENKNLIKTLTTEAQDQEFSALYWGYYNHDAFDKAKAVACYKARNDIYKQLEELPIASVDNLNEQDKREIKEKQRKALQKQKQLIKKMEQKHGYPFCKDDNKPFWTEDKCLIGLNGVYIRVLQQTPKGTIIRYGDAELFVEHNSTDAGMPEGMPLHDGIFVVDGSITYPSEYGMIFKRLRRVDKVVFMRTGKGWAVIFPN